MTDNRRDENSMTAAIPSLDIALVSQMRAGTHYMCAALRLALEAQLLRPCDGGEYGPMDDEKNMADLHAGSRFDLPPPRADRHIYFSHYYHPHYHALPPMPRLSLIGFPLDSFYSDGVVYSDAQYSAGPSGSRAHAQTYKFGYGSKEWDFLETRMHENASWLAQIGSNPADLIIRYEDLYGIFDETAGRIEQHVGGFLNPFPKPVINLKRTYWTRDFESRFDAKALLRLTEIFGDSIRRFYPECALQLEQAL